MARQVVLKKLGVAAPLAAYAQHAAESLALDAAPSADESRVALVWDEDEGAPVGNAGAVSLPNATTAGITLGVVPLGAGQPLAPRVVSGDTADPDSPRLAPRAGGGWWVAWIAHRAEGATDAGVRAATTAPVEAPAEDRVYSWIEIVAVSDEGAPAGPPRRITSATGRAASFDLALRPHGGLDVFVRDETQSREGEGGRIFRVDVAAEGTAEEPVVVVPSGAGRGSVDLVTGAGPREGDGERSWLTFSDPQDRTLVVPLDTSRAPAGAASVEEALEGGRLLALVPGGHPARFLAAFPGVEGALFRVVECAP